MEHKKQPRTTGLFWGEIWNNVTAFLQHPFVNLIVGVLVTAMFFYFVERKEIDPRYTVRENELIAAQTSDAPELELYWNGEKINDVYSIKIAFWNSGKQFLSMDNVSNVNPIHIVVPNGVQILFAEVTKTSRPTLKFSTTFISETKEIRINILDDEVMEFMDGGVVKILYTGTPDSDFYVAGRIKGNNTGFQKSGQGDMTLTLMVIIISIYIVVYGMLLYYLLRKINLTKSSKFIMIVFVLITTVLPIAFIFYGYQSGTILYIPKWAI